MLLLHNVWREYPSKNNKESSIKAVQNCSFHVQKGEILGIIGQNGAGKSTLLKIAAGILQPSGGTVFMDGLNPFHMHTNCTKLSGYAASPPYFRSCEQTVRYELDMEQAIYHLSRKQFSQKRSDLSKLLHLDRLMDQTISSLSLGQRIRVALAKLLMPEYPLLILDEPLIGLDSEMRRQLMVYLYQRSRQDKTTILISSHLLSDLQMYCDRLLLLDQGKQIFHGTFEQLKSLYQFLYRADITFAGTPPDIQELPVTKYQIHDSCMTLYFDRNILSLEELLQEFSRQATILHMEFHEPSLDDVVLSIYTCHS